MATPYKAIIKSKSRELSWKEDLLLARLSQPAGATTRKAL